LFKKFDENDTSSFFVELRGVEGNTAVFSRTVDEHGTEVGLPKAPLPKISGASIRWNEQIKHIPPRGYGVLFIFLFEHAR